MADRLPSDHDAVASHRATLSRVGRTDRAQVELPDAIEVDPGDVVRLALDGTVSHALVERTLEGEPVIRRAADNARLAREGDGPDRLQEWVADADVRVGGSVAFDVVTSGFKYGLRTPGRRVVYEATDPPSSSLSDIAADLDGD